MSETQQPSKLWRRVERLPYGRTRIHVERGVLSHVDQISLGSERQKLRFAQACEAKLPGCFDEVSQTLELEWRLQGSKYESEHDDGCKFVFTSMADLEPEPIDWLWEKYIPAGAVTILEGEPGVGKSMLLADLAARVSRGFLAPDRNPAFDEPGHDPEAVPEMVWWFSGHDHCEQTLSPRLRAAGADVAMIKLVEGTEDQKSGKCRAVAFPQDFHSLWKSRRAAPRLVIVDPLSSFCGGSLHQATARKVISELSQFASDTGAAVVVVRPLNRRVGASASERGSAGPSLTAEARSALLLANHPEDPGKLVLAVVKNNLCAKAPSLELEIVESRRAGTARRTRPLPAMDGSSANQPPSNDASIESTADEENEVASGGPCPPYGPHIAWLGQSSFDANELVRTKYAAQPARSPFEQKKVEEWLNEKLAAGPKLAKEIDEQAKLDEVPAVLLRRARLSLNIHASGRNGSAKWALPTMADLDLAPVGWVDAAKPTTDAFSNANATGDGSLSRPTATNNRPSLVGLEASTHPTAPHADAQGLPEQVIANALAPDPLPVRGGPPSSETVEGRERVPAHPPLRGDLPGSRGR